MIQRLRAILHEWVDPSDPHERHIRMGQLQLAARNNDASLKTLSMAAGGVAAGLAIWAPWPLMLGWWLAVTCSSLWTRRYLRARVLGRAEPALLKAVTIRFGLANLLQMSVFVAVAPLAWPQGEPMGQALVMLVMSATMASCVPITGPCRPVFASDMIPTAIVAIATPVALSGSEGLPAAMLAALFAFLMTNGANGAYRLAESALRLNDENVALIARLRASDKAKGEFLANMSHELRTPLNAILGFSEVMKDEMMGPIGSPTYKSYAADIHGSGQHLLGLVNDILDLAKIEAGRVDLADDLFSMNSIVDAAFNLFRVQAQKSDVTLVKDVGDDVAIRWDLRAAKQIALNLMSNALKFTPPGGTILVTSRLLADGSAFVTVRDSGCGIDPKYHEVIFESFGQGRHDLAITEKSTGLGLAIIKGLVELHGGRLTVESEVGKGAAFTIIIPPERVIPAERMRAAA